MKKITFIVAFFIIIISSFAQQVKWGELNENKSKFYAPTIVGADKNGLYTYYFDKEDIIIERHDKENLKLVYEQKIKKPKIKKCAITIEKILYIKGNFIFISNNYYRKEKRTEIIATFYDGESGRQLKKKIKLFDISSIKNKRKSSFVIRISPDKSKLLINLTSDLKKDKQIVDRFILLDEDFNVLLKKEDVFERNNLTDKYIRNFIIDNDGTIYSFLYYSESLKLLVFDAAKNFELWEEFVDITKYNNKDKILLPLDINYTINNEDEFVVNLLYNNVMVAMNKYGEKFEKAKTYKDIRDLTKSISALDGILYFRIDKETKEITVSKDNEISQEIKNEYRTKKEIKKDKPGSIIYAFKYNFSKLYSCQNGGVTSVNEAYYSVAKAGYFSSWFHYYIDILSFNFDKEGSLKWVNTIPVKQYFSYHNKFLGVFYSHSIGHWSSFFIRPNYSFGRPKTYLLDYFFSISSYSNNYFYEIFNDNPKNINLDDKDKKRKYMTKPLKSVPVIYAIDINTGKKEKKVFTDLQNEDVVFAPTVSYNRGIGSSMIVFGKKGKKYKYGVLKFN